MSTEQWLELQSANDLIKCDCKGKFIHHIAGKRCPHCLVEFFDEYDRPNPDAPSPLMEQVLDTNLYSKAISISVDEWCEIYKPIYEEEAPDSFTLKYHDEIPKKFCKHVRYLWTQLDSGHIVPGNHCVNFLAYHLTEKPWGTVFIEVRPDTLDAFVEGDGRGESNVMDELESALMEISRLTRKIIEKNNVQRS